jgi:phosphomannomutase/phosphoglucomutase
MFPKPVSDLKPNTYAYEQTPLVKPTGFREYDARWLFEKELNLMGVQALGLGLGTLLHEMGVPLELATGHDYRAYPDFTNWMRFLRFSERLIATSLWF